MQCIASMGCVRVAPPPDLDRPGAALPHQRRGATAYALQT